MTHIRIGLALIAIASAAATATSAKAHYINDDYFKTIVFDKRPVAEVNYFSRYSKASDYNMPRVIYIDQKIGSVTRHKKRNLQREAVYECYQFDNNRTGCIKQNDPIKMIAPEKLKTSIADFVVEAMINARLTVDKKTTNDLKCDGILNEKEALLFNKLFAGDVIEDSFGKCTDNCRDL